MDHLLAEGYYYSRFSNGQTICRKSGKQEMVRPEQRHPDLCEHGQSQSQRTAEERLSAALGRQQLLAELIQPEHEAPYIPALSNCVTITIGREKHNKERGSTGGLSNTAQERRVTRRLACRAGAPSLARRR